MKKRIIPAVLVLLLVIGVLAGIKALQIRAMIDQGKKMVMPPEIVTVTQVKAESWESSLFAVGSLQAVQGVTVAAEQPGKIVRIAFDSSTNVESGDLLVQLDTDMEQAQLRSLESAAALARINLDRMTELVGQGLVSKSDYDRAEAEFKQTSAQADSIRATIEKKTIRAPFSGRLGIRLVNLGQVLSEGEQIVSLQQLNPIYVDFQLPQQQLDRISTGLEVRVTTDVMDNQTIVGKITAVNTEVNAITRNIRAQATLDNKDERLRPGMFVNVTLVLPEPEKVLAVPATSVLYAPYGDSVFIVEEKKDEKTGKSGKTLRQQFVRLGDKRGDFVALISGVKDGETLVTTGVFKLRNGQAVVIDNTHAPDFSLAPHPENK